MTKDQIKHRAEELKERGFHMLEMNSFSVEFKAGDETYLLVGPRAEKFMQDVNDLYYQVPGLNYYDAGIVISGTYHDF